MRSRRRRKNFRRNQPDRRQPSNPKRPRRHKQRHDPRDGDGVNGNLEVFVITGETAKNGQEQETGRECARAVEHDGAAAEGVDEDPGESHEEEVGDEIGHGEVFGEAHAVAVESGKQKCQRSRCKDRFVGVGGRW